MNDTSLGYKIVNISSLIAMVAINVMAQTLPIGGLSTAAISDLYPTLLTPAPITFSIWFVIYLLSVGFVFRQLIGKNDAATEKIKWLFALSCLFNIAWIFSWHYQIMLFAMIAIVALWVCLMLLTKRLEDEDGFNRWVFSIYYGWITLAMAAQIFVYLSVKFPAVHVRNTALAITIAGLVIITAFAIFRIIKKKDFAFGLASLWGLTGVFISHGWTGYNMMYPIIVALCGVCIICLLGSMALKIRLPKS